VRFVGESLAALRAEMPDAYAAMCLALAPRTLRLEVDGEVVTLRFAPRAVVDAPKDEPAAVSLLTSRATIVAVIDAQHSLVSAALAGVLDLRGAPADVAAFHDAFTLYLQGGVRAPSFPRLLGAFRK
jgi:hypothetical protein